MIAVGLEEYLHTIRRLSLLLTPSGAEIQAFQGDLIAFVVCTRSCFTAFSRAFAVAPCDNLRSPRLVINRTSFGATSQASGWDTQNTRVSAPDGVNRRDTAPTNKLFDLFKAIHNVADPHEVVRISDAHDIHFQMPAGEARRSSA